MRRDFVSLCLSYVFMSIFVQVQGLFYAFCGSTFQFITFHGLVMTLHCHRKEKKLDLNPSSGGERESHPPLIHIEGSVVLPTLRARLHFHHQTFVKFNIISLQHKEIEV